MGWIGVDLDGTLAQYDSFRGAAHIGQPVPKMLERVKRWRREKQEVKIFTARANTPEAVPVIQSWCLRHIGEVLEVTSVKDYHMIELWDDRAVAVEPNTGKALSLRPDSEAFFEHR